MSDRLVIHRDREAERWSVFRLGDFPRVVKSFPTLHEAEQWICGTPSCAGRAAVAHEPTLMVDGCCPVCGEEDS